MVTLFDIFDLGSGDQVIVAQKLLVGGHPPTKDNEEDRRASEFVQNILGETLVVHGRHTVAVVKHRLLLEVKNYKGEAGDWEQDGHTKAVHEGDECDVQQSGVLVVHKVDWSGVTIKVALDRCFLGQVSITAASAVQTSEEQSETEVSERFNKWEKGIDQHGTDEGVSNRPEPHRVEVTELPAHPERDRLLL